MIIQKLFLKTRSDLNPFHGVQGVLCLEKLGSRRFTGDEVDALPTWVGCRDAGLGWAGLLVFLALLRFTLGFGKPHQPWQAEGGSALPCLREGNGKPLYGGGGESRGCWRKAGTGWILLAGRGGRKIPTSGQKKKKKINEGRANHSFSCCCCHGQGYQPCSAGLSRTRQQGEILVSHAGWRGTELSCCRNESQIFGLAGLGVPRGLGVCGIEL